MRPVFAPATRIRAPRESSELNRPTPRLKSCCEHCREQPVSSGAARSSISWTPEPLGRLPIVERTLLSAGQPLDGGLRAAMEQRFGHDFSAVRVHAGESAAESARAIDARAYTVGKQIVFGAGQYVPAQPSGQRLIAHELAHVIQQSHCSGLQPWSTVSEPDDPAEREAHAAADAVMASRAPRVTARTSEIQLQRHKDDIVAYTGGQTGSVFVIEAGKLIFTARAVSGHPGHSEAEVNVGPTPTGSYFIHPGITRPPVTSLQFGVCGCNAISSGYQEITCTTPSPCTGTGAHYCNIACPTTEDPARKCFTPQDCWGPKRIRIEGSADVPVPGGAGRTVHRDGFYLHGGNSADPVSSGCIKSMDVEVFPKVRSLTGVGGAVPFCVGSACPPLVTNAVQAAVVKAIQNVLEGVRRLIPF